MFKTTKQIIKKNEDEVKKPSEEKEFSIVTMPMSSVAYSSQVEVVMTETGSRSPGTVAALSDGVVLTPYNAYQWNAFKDAYELYKVKSVTIYLDTAEWGEGRGSSLPSRPSVAVGFTASFVSTTGNSYEDVVCLEKSAILECSPGKYVSKHSLSKPRCYSVGDTTHATALIGWQPTTYAATVAWEKFLLASALPRDVGTLIRYIIKYKVEFKNRRDFQ